MKLPIIISLILVSISFQNIFPNNPATNSTTLSGTITDYEDGEVVPFINVVIEGSRNGAITNISGFYQISNLTPGTHTIVVSGMGYLSERVELSIERGQNLQLNIKVRNHALNMDEIVITSSPTARGFRYQPDNIYTGEDLQRRADISFGEMLDGEPGVAMRSMGPTPSRPVIRGLDGDRILILQNGERMGDISETSAGHAISLDPISATRVEVVRGPASLLYGSSAIGGVINLMTPDIPERWDMGSSGVVSLQGATNNNMGAGFMRFTQGGENFAGTARISYRESGDVNTPGGYIPGTFTENFDGSVGLGYNRNGIEGGLNFSMGAQSYGIPEELDNPFANPEVRINQKMFQGRLNFRINNFFDKAQIRVHASNFIQQEIEVEIDGNEIHEELEIEFNKFNYSSTLTVQHKPVGIFDRGAIGLNIYGRRLNIKGDNAFTPNEERINLGLFTFQEIPLGPGLRFQVGGRLDFLRATALPNDFSSNNEQRDAFVYSGSAGLNFRPVENLEIGAQIARSHRYPMLEELFANGPHLCAGVYETGNINLGDEIGYGADLFARWSNGNIKTEIAGFYNQFSNYIIMQPTGQTDVESGLPIVEYIGDKARLAGGEFSLNWEIVSGFSTALSIDYVAGTRLNNNNDPLPFIPPFRFSGSVEYDYGKGWFGSRIRTAAAQNRISPDEESTNGYSTVELNTGYRMNSTGQHVIIIRVQNLFNTEYRDHLSRIEERNFPMPGRNFNLAYRWFF